MTTRAEFEDKWKDKSPEERREALNTLALDLPESDDDDLRREHDALATLVAQDEDTKKE